MTNNQLTRERLEKIKAWRETYGAGSNVMLPAEEAEELARMMLAAMDSEPNRNPVLAYADSYRDMEKQGVESVPIWSVITDLERNIAPLYRHAQQPVVPEEMNFSAACNFVQINGMAKEDRVTLAMRVWNACRAAILQAQSDDDGEPTDDERIMAIEGIHNCERCGDEGWVMGEMGITRCACGQAGNSPVIPEWIPVSERLPAVGHKVLAYRPDAPESDDPLIRVATYVGKSAHGHGFDCYCKTTHWMPLPAAPQEVKGE
ncbi:Protein of uncharacterised function (DUF551) [Klebsiella pneumoniae]|uniref:DUF551 domain-containing protein n=1 Tax=Klebsiella pneumoniae TaxID=573 RepID=UPI000E2A4A0A|nr:DUF551 domain-containing protein [Klebsiella pneumoniae]SXT96064.1 Protein of uncharacterised function (DUF551) [Klebsiella pneumoniae]